MKFTIGPIALALLPGAVTGGTLFVPLDYPTIQTALDAAAVGDTIQVAPGTYTGPGNRDLSFGGKDLALLGAGAGKTILDCEGSPSAPHRAFDFRSGERAAATVEGFTIRNGYSANWGGGINCRGASPTIRGCVIERCVAGTFGGGVAIWDGSGPLLDGCVLAANTAGTHGGGVGVTGSRAVLRGCSIVENGAMTWGGGVFVDIGEVTVEGTAVEGNTAGASGGGISIRGASQVILDSRIVGNSSGGGGGGIVTHITNDLVMERVLVSGNTSGGAGGLWYSRETTGSIRSTTITGNRGGNEGGGAYIRGSLEIDDSIFSDNCSPIGPEFYAHADALIDLSCCAIDTSRVDGPGTVEILGGLVLDDPGFCQPILCEEAPTSDGDFHLQTDSPCLPENNACGVLVGALPGACDPASTPDGNPESRFPWVYPSPLRPDDVLFLRLLPGDRQVGVYDANGRRLGDLYEGQANHSLETAVRIGAVVPGAGVYFVRTVNAGGVSRTAQIVVRE